MSSSSSPRTPSDPGNCYPEATVLQPLDDGDQQRGELIGTSTGGLEGLECPLVKDARNVECEGRGEEPQQPHRRHANLRERRAHGEPDAHEYRPGDVLDEARDDRFESQKIPKAGPEQDQQPRQRQAE